MSWMCAFIRDIHVPIFRFLIYFNTQFSCFVKLISLEYIQVHICNMISKTPFIYEMFSRRLINSLIHVSTSFLLPLIVPKPSFINLLNIIGHFIDKISGMTDICSVNMIRWVQYSVDMTLRE